MAKDEVFVNVKSTNLWDEVYETGGLYASDGADWATSDRIRSKNYISVQGGSDYYFQIPSAYQIIVCWYDSEKTFISTTNYGYASAITAPANAAYCRFATSGSYGTTYNHDISISLGSSATPYMPHDTKGKVWKKQNILQYEFPASFPSWASWSQNGANCYQDNSTSSHIGNIIGSWGTVMCLCDKAMATSQGNIYTNPTTYSIAVGDNNKLHISNDLYANRNLLVGAKAIFQLATPIWADITSSAMGAALLAMETYEGDSNTATIDNNGQSNVEYWRQV